MVFTTLAAVSATLATVIVSNVLVYIQAAPVGDLRERFAATATTAVHVGVVLFVVALVSFLVSFSTVGYGTGFVVQLVISTVHVSAVCATPGVTK